MFGDLDPAQAWIRRVQSGQAGAIMTGGLGQLGTQRAATLVRRLDHAHQERRIAFGSAAASAGRGAQHRDHAVGLGRSEGVSA